MRLGEFCQIRQDVGLDFIRAKESLVLSEAEISEPTPDIHGALHGPERIIVRLKHPGPGFYASSLALREVASPRKTRIA